MPDTESHSEPKPSVTRAVLLGLTVFAACLGASVSLVRLAEAGPRPEDAILEASLPHPPRSPRVLAGSGSNLALTQRLVARFVEGGGSPLEVELDSVGSGGGLRALRDDVIDAALVSRDLRDREREGLRAQVYARTEVVLASTGRTHWAREELPELFRGDSREVTPLLRELGDSGVASMRTVWPELAEAHDEAVRAQRFEVLYTDDAMARALADVRDAIGFFDRGQLRTRRLPAVALEGVAAPKPLLIVVRDERLDDFLAFLASAEAHRVIVEAGYEVP
ncbi:MAG: hypothetical protein H6720_04910 [Sandaracinus sp.]|nr:hypothetical protein [Sandaracinus sp.]